VLAKARHSSANFGADVSADKLLVSLRYVTSLDGTLDGHIASGRRPVSGTLVI